MKKPINLLTLSSNANSAFNYAALAGTLALTAFIALGKFAPYSSYAGEHLIEVIEDIRQQKENGTYPPAKIEPPDKAPGLYPPYVDLV